MSSTHRPRRGALLDVDGTLVDTTYVHVLGWWQALDQFGHHVPMAAIHRAIGMGSDRILDHLLGEDRDRGDDDQMAAAHLAHAATFWSRLQPLPGAAELLRRCKAAGLVVVLASSASARELTVLRRALDADDAIDAATSSDDADASKPAPDILAAALDAGGLEPAEAVFVGDAVWDVRSAARLAIPCVGLASGGVSEAELAEAGAVATYPSAAAVVADFDSSPLAPD